MAARFDDIGSGMAGLELGSSRFLNSLPVPVRQRVETLKEFQKEKNKIAARFQADVWKLEKEYWDRYEPLFIKRFQIVNGQSGSSAQGTKGIPNFWLLALRNHAKVSPIISKRDEDALKSLVDVGAKYLEGKRFQLFFRFAPNPYFTNSVLTKTYSYEDDPITGLPAPANSTGDRITWQPGKNLTMKIKRKKGNGKAAKQASDVSEVPVDSFFDFFSPQQALNAGHQQANESDDWLRTMDFELGECFKDEIIPRALYWYTGEASEDPEIDDISMADDGIPEGSDMETDDSESDE